MACKVAVDKGAVVSKSTNGRGLDATGGIETTTAVASVDVRGWVRHSWGPTGKGAWAVCGVRKRVCT